MIIFYCNISFTELIDYSSHILLKKYWKCVSKTPQFSPPPVRMHAQYTLCVSICVWMARAWCVVWTRGNSGRSDVACVVFKYICFVWRAFSWSEQTCGNTFRVSESTCGPSGAAQCVRERPWPPPLPSQLSFIERPLGNQSAWEEERS